MRLALQKGLKRCGNCQYWSGSKKIYPNGTFVEVESNEYAICGYWQVKKRADNTCPTHTVLSIYK